MGAPYPCTANCGDCPVTCEDGSKKFITQMSFLFDDLGPSFRLWARTANGSNFNYSELLCDLTDINGTYVISKDSSCNWPAAPQYTLSTSKEYTNNQWTNVPPGSCPAGTPDSTSVFSDSFNLRIYINSPTDIEVVLNASTSTWTVKFKPSGPITDECAIVSLVCDTNIYADDGTKCTGSYSEGFYYATATPA